MTYQEFLKLHLAWADECGEEYDEYLAESFTQKGEIYHGN